MVCEPQGFLVLLPSGQDGETSRPHCCQQCAKIIFNSVATAAVLPRGQFYRLPGVGRCGGEEEAKSLQLQLEGASAPPRLAYPEREGGEMPGCQDCLTEPRSKIHPTGRQSQSLSFRL